MNNRQQRILCLAASLFIVQLGCGNQGSGSGNKGSGGSTASAGGSGGSSSNGGNSGNGGSSAAGNGGSSAAGGTQGMGGSSGVGTGGRATGGVTGSGGSAATGGTTSGGLGTGGASGTGAATGGAKGTGGVSGTGGNPGTGGAQGTGGIADAGAGTGGATGTGGTTTDAGTSPWPQCWGTDKVPTTTLLQRAPSGSYATQITSGGVAMLIGSTRQACITDTVANFDVKDLNQELIDVVETVKFYGLLDWKRGYNMNWVILNSGISGATIAAQGGHQGDRWGHMNFESSEECPCNWGTGDDANRGSALHESIHVLQAELWAFNNQASGWIHEAHNCYTATMRAHMVENKYTEGWGTALTLQMPHGPIESMGMNTDGSWAGPADQNATTYVNSINRYGLEIFWLVVNLEMGQGFINCTWDAASKAGKPDSRVSGTLSVIQAMAKGSSWVAVADVIQRFGARSAILDFDGWTSVMRSNLKGNWNSKYWFYVFPSGDGTTAFSPPTIQIPRHQGRNVIPIKVASGATSVTVEFTPDATGSKGTTENMQAQLVYRDTADNPVYGTVFSSGQNTIQLPNGVRNGIVNLVVAVTNPNGTSAGDDGSGKGFDAQETFNYKARIVSGGTIAPTTTTPW
jgi:hypothetical protein